MTGKRKRAPIKEIVERAKRGRIVEPWEDFAEPELEPEALPAPARTRPARDSAPDSATRRRP